jgi:hypothetical protein
MAKGDCLPPFTLAYFPLNDDVGHKRGISTAAEECIEKFDAFLARLVEVVGGWDAVGDSYSFLIVGDHSQVEWSGDGPETLALDQLFGEFSLADTGAGFQGDEDLMVCPNMRAAVIYLARRSMELRDTVIQKLIHQVGVDQVIWQDQDARRSQWYRVLTGDRGQFRFMRTRESSQADAVVDQYKNQWRIEGELATLDLRSDAEGNLIEGVYPNPLERIEGSFAGESSSIWVTARPNVELTIAESSVHQGGSHGSLLDDDSNTALITSRDVQVGSLLGNARPRIVDVMDLCLSSLGVRRSSGAELHQRA